MKSNAAAKGSAAAAEAAARRAFTAAPSLPLDGAAASEAGALEGRRRLSGAFLIEVGRIRPDPAQPRKQLDTEAQRELTDSVRRLGILQPITVRYLESESIYQIISGERRYQAALAAGLAEMPCWVQSPKSEHILLHQIVENWQRAELHPYELADALTCLRDAGGYTQRQLAELTGKPESEISRLLSLLKLNPAVQQAARQDATGTYTKRHLVALAQLPPEDQQEVMIAVRQKNLTALDTERAVQTAKAKRQGTRGRGAPMGERLRYVTSKATVTFAFRRAHITADQILATLDEVREQVTTASENEASAG